LERITKQADAEKDPVVKQWMTMMVEDEKARGPAMPPATAPAREK
jgi:hypothetical protein